MTGKWLQITERPILDCICPMCNLPDLHSNGGKHEEYFPLLLASLTSILDENIMHVFEKKLTDIALLSDPNFVWCIRVSALSIQIILLCLKLTISIQCTSGFVNNLQTKVVICPDCRVRFCSECKKVVSFQTI